MEKYKFIISGGGTGGHIYPAIAIAEALKERFPESEFLFVGAQDKMEMEKVPQAGYAIEGLWISGIQRRLTLANMMFPFKLLSSLWKSRKIINRFKPDMVVGTGGFASGPLLKVASEKGIPCVLQEQNSYPGITNKWLAPKVEKIFVAYEGLEKYFPASRIMLTGNPVRRDLLSLEGRRAEGLDFFGFNASDKVLFVMGGSLGAREINRFVAAHLDEFLERGYKIIWQCGKLYYDTYAALESESVKVMAFINQMPLAYAAADVIISRAGAGSVSELALVGKPVIFIPSPNVAEDHQTRNAMAITEQGAALMVAERNLENEFFGVFDRIQQDPEWAAGMAGQFKSLGKPGATRAIVDEIEKILIAKKHQK